jgi:hypothetical protein
MNLEGAGTGVPGVEGAGVDGPLGEPLSGVPRCMNLRLRVPVEIDMAGEWCGCILGSVENERQSDVSVRQRDINSF